MDVTNQDQIQKSVETVATKCQNENLNLVGLINNAGYNETSVLELVPGEKLRKQFDVNVLGQVAVTQAFLPLLRKYGNKSHQPRIVFVSSGFGRITFPMTGPYCASKYAIEAIGDAFRMEL